MPVIFENVPNLTFAKKISFLARVTITTHPLSQTVDINCLGLYVCRRLLDEMLF